MKYTNVNYKESNKERAMRKILGATEAALRRRRQK
jgi:hypothetical protein